MCCTATAPDQEQIYFDLIKGKEHLLHESNYEVPRDQTKSGGVKFDIMGKDFDGNSNDLNVISEEQSS